jgi:predicted acyl esterase
VPGAIETYQLDLWGTCVGAKPGERLRLSIMSGAFPLLARNLNTGGDLATETTPVVADQAVHHGPGRRSFVTLPVIDRPEWIAKP